jgi:hypothetical protein
MGDEKNKLHFLFVQASIFLIAPALARSASCCYGIEELTIDHAQHIAPRAVQQFMQSAVQCDFSECVQESGLSPDACEHYFGSVKIALSRQAKKHHLVFPSSYCGAFHGAHAIAYWLVEEVTPIRFRILYSGRSDGLTLRDTASHGYYDVESYYGSTYILLRFNGKTYRRISHGTYYLKDGVRSAIR